MHRSICKIALAGLLILVAGAAAVSAQEAAIEAPSALTVELVAPQRQEWAQTVSASGWLTPWDEAVVAPETGGLKISAILVDVGSAVRKGDLLAELSSESILADIQKQDAAVATAQANLDEADANVERSRQLDGSGAISDQTKTQYLITRRTAAASLASEQAGLKSQQIKLQQTKIVAVDDGVISSRTATLGAVVSSGTEMFRLIRQDRIEWQAEVPSIALNAVHDGQAAELKLGDGSALKGTVRLISPTIDKTTDRALVFVSLASPAPKTGQFVSGTIEVGRTASLAVPQTAIVQRDGMSYIFVMADATHVQRKRVETGRRQGDLVEITTALDDATLIVKSGGAFLSDGATVKVLEPAKVTQ